MDHENKTVIVYRTLFEASGIPNSNSGLQITNNMYPHFYFMLFFILTPERSSSVVRKYHPDRGNIRIELKFSVSLLETTTCLLYLECDMFVLVDFSRNVTTEF